MDDSLIQSYNASELEIAAEFLTNWLPFLTRGLCDPCSTALRRSVLSLRPGYAEDPGPSTDGYENIEPTGWVTDTKSASSVVTKDEVDSPKARMLWADMAQEDELEEEVEEESRKEGKAEEEEGKAEEEEEKAVSGEEKTKKKMELSRQKREYIRFMNVGRKKDFICLERVNKKIVNILDGLELHTGVFSVAEQKRIVDFVYELQEKGRNGQLRERTYSEHQSQKWMRGKGRVTIQFGCYYNYAVDKKYGNLPGILWDVAVDPMPPLFKVIIRRLVRWHIVPASCIPDSCIINIYEPGDCIPPHIDNHDFVRPFTTVSFLRGCNVLFGSDLKIGGVGEFSSSIAIPLPVGSVLVLNGNGADIAKHCVPAIPTKRISITFRRMDESKRPSGFVPEPDLQNIQPLPYDSAAKEPPYLATDGPPQHSRSRQPAERRRSSNKGKELAGNPVGVDPGIDSQNNTPVVPTPDMSQRWPYRTPDGSHAMSGNSMNRRKQLVERLSKVTQNLDPHPRNGGEQLLRTFPHRDVQAGTDKGSSDWEGSNGPAKRWVRMEQSRIMISRNMDGGDEPFAMRSQDIDPSCFRIQTLDNGRRRVSVSLSD